MSIHKIRAPFVRCDYRPTPLDARKRHHNPPPPQHGLRFFFGGVIGTDTEKKLAQMMSRQLKGAA